MRKYLAVSKIRFKAQFIYRFDVLLTALETIWRVIFAWIVWGAIFAERDQMAGFTFQSMLSYYVISSFLAGMDMSDGVSHEISGRIREGSFSKFMVIPAHPQFYCLFQTLGESGYYGLFAALAAAVSTLIFKIDLVFTADPVKILLALATILLGVLFMNSYHFFIGLWSFKFQDIGFLLHGLPLIIWFLKGELVPLSLLPDTFADALHFIPFTHTVYTPAMLLIDGLDYAGGMTGCAVMAVWTLGLTVLGRIMYTRLRTKYEGVGI